MKDKKNDKDLERFYNMRSDKFTIILNDNELEFFKSAKSIVHRFCTDMDLSPVFIACIKHDKDIDEETHHLKTIHYHVVVQLNKICRVQTLINRIMYMFSCHENQITLDKCNSLVMQTRYLCHLDDFDKYQYWGGDVVTNDNDVLKRYFDLIIIRDLHDLVGVVKHFNYDFEEIMLHVAHYDKWRKYINDLIINYNRRCR